MNYELKLFQNCIKHSGEGNIISRSVVGSYIEIGCVHSFVHLSNCAIRI